MNGNTAPTTIFNHPGITSACCWSHARRGFANLYKASREPRAAMALRKIAGLYR
ncbi:transposase, partial [Escherichia coli]|uniref:IS66 family transposase n=1 Tax=Escherichia coli TaxID=562 RepID=UPI00390A353B